MNMKKNFDSKPRMERILNFLPVDKPGLCCDINAVGIYEHGEKLRDLIRSADSDFGPVNEEKFILPQPEDFDAEGRYYVIKTDEWGVAWEYRIFGIAGHPLNRPLDDWSNLNKYCFPRQMTKQEITKSQNEINKLHQKKYFLKRGWISYFEKSIAVRRFEDVLADIVTRDDSFMQFNKRLHEYNRIQVDNLLSTGVDAIQFADDFGTQDSLIISPEYYREIYKPMFKELVSMVKKAGKRALYHTCGYSWPLLKDFAEIGFDEIWPQLNCYDLKEFAEYCRDLKITVAIHPERSELMTFGKPDEIKKRINEYHEAFRPHEGGAYYYLEIDNGFPYENILAMINEVKALRL